MTIIGRHREKSKLKQIASSNQAEFLAVYGRRRIGKTFLIREYFKAKKHIYFQTTGIANGSLAEQLERFTHDISQTFYHGIALETPTSWLKAFELLTQSISLSPKNKKIILFFDELPWLATRRSGIIAALEYFWNRHWSDDKRIKLIVCGSSASWIIKNILFNRGGLHNRLSGKIKLDPFNLQETELYIKHLGLTCTKQQICKLYMCMGGIPYYLNQINKNLSVDANINQLFFNQQSILFNEFKEVFLSLFENFTQYQELIELIAKHHEGVARDKILHENSLTGNGGRLSARLEDLENTGFITSYIPFGHEKRGTLYRLTDQFCYFYLKWVAPIRNKIKPDSTANYWQAQVNTPAFYNWQGYAFENICYRHIAQIKKVLALPEISFASPWRYSPLKTSNKKGAQIDLLFDRSDDAITICEIKYTNKPFKIDKSYCAQLKERLKTFKTVTRCKKQLLIAMISGNGLVENTYSDDLISKVVTLEDLFK